MTNHPTAKFLDSATALRVLANTSLRVADGEKIETAWLIQQLKTGTEPGPSSAVGSLLTIPEAADQLRLSRWGVYDLLHKKDLLSVKQGRRRFIPSSEIHRYLESLPLTGGQLL
ncbi:helix-turn-helix domain-containing protein [Nocardia sp. alder85J]|uniref:helix-turn-helix domain-containing protein n=1 Tax=Nocardia sp. alder85J TaxID=2862949 RepID=UPI001CD27B8C|nr:helix-turn-helix domain-containing protein [Nocardia sp. alder85J]MCX4097400.1 helix-turn-helix domain-containing protein [Nocardia sp. alder85J]